MRFEATLFQSSVLFQVPTDVANALASIAVAAPHLLVQRPVRQHLLCIMFGTLGSPLRDTLDVALLPALMLA